MKELDEALVTLASGNYWISVSSVIERGPEETIPPRVIVGRSPTEDEEAQGQGPFPKEELSSHITQRLSTLFLTKENREKVEIQLPVRDGNISISRREWEKAIA